MEGKEAIINKIIEDANEKALAIVNKATDASNEKIAQAKNWAEEYTKAQEKLLEQELFDIVERRKTVAKLDSRKISLAVKQELIDATFNKALDLLLRSSKDEYLALVERLINEYADDGDAIVLCDDNVLSVSDVKGFEAYTRFNMSICEKRGSFKGGVLLIGKTCDKDLSFEALIKSKKEEYSKSISESLF